MGRWALLLGGLVVWTIHFFGAYAIVSIFLDTLLARGLILALTAACLAADALLLHRAMPAIKSRQGNDMDRWIACVAAAGAGISFVAVLWQGLPALLG